MSRHSDAVLDTAWSEARHGHFIEAIRMLENLPETESKPQRLASLAHFYFMLSKLDSAEIYAGKALHLNAKSKLALMTAGAIHQKKQDCQSAVKYFQEAFRLYPEDAFAGLRLASTHIELRDYNAAIEILENLRDLDPKNREILDKLEFAYLFSGDRQKSKQIRDCQDEMFAGDEQRSIDSFLVSLESKTSEEAIRLLEKIMTVSIYRDNAKINRKIADLHISQNQFKEAIPYLEKTMEGRERNDNIRLKLASCMVRSGRADEARVILDSMRYLETTPGWIAAKVEALAAAGLARESMDMAFQALLKHPRNRRLRQIVVSLRKRGYEPSPGILETDPDSGP
jgi:tetratricopeptide (TPR) repeat protein